MRGATVLLAVVVVLVAASAWADFEAGQEAFEQGDYAPALKEFRALAEQGDADAQYTLGLMYELGQGVQQDYVQAYLWFNLAAAQGDEGARKDRDILAEQMTLAQIGDAQRLAREWKARSK